MVAEAALEFAVVISIINGDVSHHSNINTWPQTNIIIVEIEGHYLMACSVVSCLIFIS